MKTADEVQVGDVIMYRSTRTQENITITVTDISEDNHGCVLFSGIDNKREYHSDRAVQIVQYISQAKHETVKSPELTRMWQSVETFSGLKKFVEENMNGCTVTVIDSEIVILTGAGYDMGGILYGLNEDE